MNLPLSRHPSFSRLRAFALGEANEAQRRRVARHLERCVRCRETISRVREIVAAARELETPPAGALERILERRGRGERGVLPVAPAGGTTSVRRLPRIAAILVLGAGALVYTFARTGELEALRSELRVTPAAPRLGEADPRSASMVANMLANFPAQRSLTAEYLRADIDWLSAALERAEEIGSSNDDQPHGPERGLTQTAAEYAGTLRLALGWRLTVHGTTLLALGDTAAALDTLSFAFDIGWDPQRFRTIGELYLARGDTAAAAAAFARVVVDPTTSEAADSLRARLGAAGAGPAWKALLAEARLVMKEHVWNGAVDRAPLLPRLRLEDADGRARVVELRQGTPMLVAFRSRYCPGSFTQLDEMARVAARLEAEGVPVIAVSPEEPATLREFMDAKGYRFPVFSDPQRDAAAAFDTPGFPAYFVLDGTGRIRFAHNDIGRVIREVAALREQAREQAL